MNNYNNDKKRNNYNNNNNNNLNFQLEKLHLNDGDIVIIKCLDNSIPNSEYKNLIRYIKQVKKVDNVILAPKEITLETVNEESLQEIIDKLIQLRDNKWKNKLHKGE